MQTRNISETPLIGNPFHFLPTEPSEFVGRWPLVEKLAIELAVGRSSYGIVGGRRCGKTSVLNVLCHMLQHDEKFNGRVLPLFVDPTLTHYTAPEHFFGSLLAQLQQRIDAFHSTSSNEKVLQVNLATTGIDTVLAHDPPLTTAENFATVVNTMLDRLADAGGPRRLILLLDEMDSLLDYSWHKDFFAQQRASIVSGPAKGYIRLVLAGSRRFVEEATSRGSPLYNVLQLRYLSALNEDAITQLTARIPNLSNTVRQAVCQQSGGHPFLATYLLHHLWELDSTSPTADDVAALADMFIQNETMHLDGWSRALGLVGLQIYSLFVNTSDWLTKSFIIQTVNEPKLPVTDALTALYYHCFIVSNATRNQYRRGGELISTWYRTEIRRLLEEFTLPEQGLQSVHPFFFQLITHGPLQAAFGQHIAQAANTGSGGLAYGAGAQAAGEHGVVAHTIHGPVSTGDHARQITAASDHSDDPVAQSPSLQSLRAILSTLYETEVDARRIAQDAGLDIRQVNFSTKSINFWQHMLVEAHKQDKVKALISTASFEYGAKAEALRQAYQAYTSSS